MKTRIPKFRDDDRNTSKKRKSNRPKEPYVRKDKYHQHWENFIEQEDIEEERER